ncbi:hypothetical protein QWY20_16240 [Alkalimonas sp. MEB108]|uniref:Uncharacterized protein n=1 Tax=Alkalimonas cellulosilytica TaxID=3058395 RepID=A0ABU7J906_9GAMM|nr:hypothetical protein [Alkalimonas sp. MEB108]MEE2003009.1 hypothetical protein [Alkalimonas sp. MEB108]
MNIISLYDGLCPPAMHKANRYSLSEALSANDVKFTAIAGVHANSLNLWSIAKGHFPSLPCYVLLDDGQWVEWHWHFSLPKDAVKSSTQDADSDNLPPAALAQTAASSKAMASTEASAASKESKESAPSASVAPVPEPAAASAAPVAPASSDTPAKEGEHKVDVQACTPKANDAVSDKVINQRDFEIFKRFSWGEKEWQQAERFFEQQLDWAQQQGIANPALLKRFETARRHGKQAAELIAEMRQRLKSDDEQVVRAWLEKARGHMANRAIKASLLKLDKEVAFIQRKKKQRQALKKQPFVVDLPTIYHGNGVHPHAIRQLQPSASWTMLIDEGGEQFGLDASQLSLSDKSLGRAVALLVPEHATLPPLAMKTHSTDLDAMQVQALVKTILAQPVGVFGAQVNDDLLSGSWLGSIEQLVRWVLLLLPVKGPTKVQVLIEQRGDYSAQQADLRALADVIESQLVALLPDRFGGLRLSFAVVDKQHPHNGYVDAIAHLWSTPTREKKQILAHTGWQHHCLLQNSKMPAIERLYRRVLEGELPEPAAWLDACTSAPEESEASLLHDVLAQTARRAQQQPAVLSAYLAQVQQRIRERTIAPGQLVTALQWLQAQLPKEQWPLSLACVLESSSLVAENHLGLFDADRVAALQHQAEQLAEEDAQLACQLMLRLASSCTNNYQFGQVSQVVSSWLRRPVETVGLLNRGKLLSTEGQLLAFQGQHALALSHFDDAIATFERLSDPVERRRQVQQSWHYRAVTLLAQGEPQAANEVQGLVKLALGDQMPRAMKQLAESGFEHQYLHYLVMRALVQFPVLQDMRQSYLANQDSWDMEPTHPWMLIQAYRGWMLAEAKQTEQATLCFEHAIAACQAHTASPILLWMGHCLAALGQSLGLAISVPSSAQPLPAVFPQVSLPQLARAESNKVRFGVLEQLLPFNFH